MSNSNKKLANVSTTGNIELDKLEYEGIKDLSNEVLERYHNSDLKWLYVEAVCVRVGLLKGIDLHTSTIKGWFVEFLQMGWNKATFDKRAKALITKEVFNRIDIVDWIKAEKVFTEPEMYLEMERIMRRKIKEAEDKKRTGLTLSEADQLFINFSVAERVLSEFQAERAGKFEDMIREEARKLVKQKKIRIKTLPLKYKDKLFNRLVVDKKIKYTGDYEAQIMLQHLEDFGDFVPDSYLDEIEKEKEDANVENN